MFNFHAIPATSKPAPPTAADALQILAALIQKEKQAIEIPANRSETLWSRYLYLCRQFDAICDVTGFPSVPSPDTLRRAQMAVKEATHEHLPCMSRVLGAAHLVELVGSVAHYVVASESTPGTVHHVAIDTTGRGSDSCTCRATKNNCFHIRNAREYEALRVPPLVQIENMCEASFDALDTLDDVTIGYPSEARKPSKTPQISADFYSRERVEVDYIELAEMNS